MNIIERTVSRAGFFCGTLLRSASELFKTWLIVFVIRFKLHPFLSLQCSVGMALFIGLMFKHQYVLAYLVWAIALSLGIAIDRLCCLELERIEEVREG